MAAEYDLVVGTLDIGNGHVDNTVFPEYVAEARERFLRERVGDAFDDYMRPVVRLELDYHAELFAGDRVTAAVSLEEVGTTSFTTTVRVTHEGAPVVTAKTVQVIVDPATDETVPVPEAWRTGLEA